MRGRQHIWTEEERKIMRDMYLEYRTQQEMAVALGVNRSTLSAEIVRERNRGNLPERKRSEASHVRAKIKQQQMLMEADRESGAAKSEKLPMPQSEYQKHIDRFVKTGSSLCWLCQRALPNSTLPYACHKPVKGFDADRKERFDPGTKELIGYSYVVKKCPRFKEEPWVGRYVERYGSLII